MHILKATNSDFDFIFSEIERNFISDERRDYNDALSLYESGKYEILHFISGVERVGFLTVWTFPDFAFAEHFVIYERYRNRGYGATALAALKKLYSKIVLEAEPPITDIAKRRLNFYERNGFVQNKKPYMQPAYRKGGHEVPLIIMSYPTHLENFDEVILRIKKEAYLSK